MIIPDELRKQAEKLRLRLYASNENEDFLLLHWWIDLHATGELSDILEPASRSLSQMFETFKPPTTFIYALNSKNKIEFAWWAYPSSLHPTDRTLICGLWLSDPLRSSKRGVQLTTLVYKLAFCHYDYILGTTWQKDKLKVHRSMGYEVTGFVPHIYGVDNVFFVLLSKGNFEQSKMYRLNERIGV